MNNKNHGELFDYDDPIYICNPFTKETVRLPLPPPQLVTVPKDAKKAWGDFTVIGFGYLYSTNEYKIVRIYYNECSIFCEGQVQVYTLGDKSAGWRNIGTTDHYLNKLECANGILYDGDLHWITNMGTEIVAFGLADEKFRSVPIPTCILQKYDFHFPRLLMLGGYLSIALQGSSRHGHCSCTEIWSFKPMKSSKLETGHEFTIYSKHSFPPSICHPIALKEENNKVLLWDVGRGRTLCHFDTKTATLEEFVYENFDVFRVIPHMKSDDVSLTALGADLSVVNWDNCLPRIMVLEL